MRSLMGVGIDDLQRERERERERERVDHNKLEKIYYGKRLPGDRPKLIKK